MNEQEILAELRRGPLSGGKLMEWMQGAGGPKRALVYAALENLRARGDAAVVAEGPGERIYGVPGARPPPPRPPGDPPAFALDPKDRATIESCVARMTRGLPPHYFEEIRRAVVADAERRVFRGERPRRAVEGALADVGPEAGVRRLLRAVERGGPVPPAVRSFRLRLPVGFLVVVAGLVLARLFLVGVYSIEWSSMEPALAPRSEGGDALVLVNLRAFASSPPARGDIAVFRGPERGELYVKRVMGLPGETIALGGGDLFVDGERLVKERALLDRLKVPLFAQADFERGAEGARYDQREPVHDGLRDASGRVERGDPCVEAVLVARVRASAQPCTIAFVLREGAGSHAVVLRTTGPGTGASVAGAEIATGPEFLLTPGTWREVWITNADRVFRVELDGREAARAPLATYGPSALFSIEITGAPADVEGLEVARDALYGQGPHAPDPRGGAGAAARHEWRLGKDEFFLLGDNSGRSRDSRHFGPVPAGALVGRAFCVAWPPSRMRALR